MSDVQMTPEECKTLAELLLHRELSKRRRELDGPPDLRGGSVAWLTTHIARVEAAIAWVESKEP